MKCNCSVAPGNPIYLQNYIKYRYEAMWYAFSHDYRKHLHAHHPEHCLVVSIVYQQFVKSSMKDNVSPERNLLVARTEALLSARAARNLIQ